MNQKKVNSFLDNDIRNFGKYFLAPYLIEFCQYIHSIKTQHPDPIILLFVSRDGYLIKKIYDILYPAEQKFSKYCLASRFSFEFMSLVDKNSIFSLFEKSSQYITINQFLKQKLGLGIQFEDAIANTLICNNNNVKDFFYTLNSHFFDEVISKAQQHKKHYYQYLKDLTKNNAVSIIDIGYTGTTQKNIASILRKKIDGYYLTTFHKAKGNLENIGSVYSFDGAYVKPNSKDAFVSHHRYTLEAILTGHHKSFLYFTDDQKPIFEEVGCMGKKSSSIIQNIFDGAISSVKQYKESSHIAPIYSYQNMKELFYNPSFHDAILFDGLEFQDGFMGQQKEYIIMHSEKNFRGVWTEAILSARQHNNIPLYGSFLPKILQKLELYIMGCFLTKWQYAQFISCRKSFLKKTPNKLLHFYTHLTSQ